MNRPRPADFFKDWKDREALAEAMIPLIGRLYRNNNVSLYMYGRNMVHRSVIDLMKLHRFVRQIEHNELSVYETFPVVDSKATITNGDTAVVYCWYDNEFGYCCQVVRTLEKMAGVEWEMYPRSR